MSEFVHVTVLSERTVDLVEPRAGGIYVDCTLGGGGHAELLLEKSAPDGRVIGIDRDPAALAAAAARLSRFGDRVRFAHARFGEFDRVLSDLGESRVHGIVADVGVSSPQLDDASRGFSLMREGPLDMRMDPTSGESALELIERLSENELADVIYEYGEERRSRAVARSIKRALDEGALATTEDLARAIRRVVGPRKGRLDPATRAFQGLRIAVNGELDELRALCACAPDRLVDGGVIAIISFHSLEDRIVKHAFRDDPRLAVLTKKPLEADDDELSANPRARSAKLRGARRLPREVD